MVDLKHLGKDRITLYDVYLFGAASTDDLPQRFRVPSERFVCLLAMDARATPVETISKMAEKLLNAGAAYICSWGPDCERVHDIIDEVIVGSGVTPIGWADVMTTWHDKDSLKDAAEFFLWSAAPADPYLDRCSSAIAVRIGSEFDIVELELQVLSSLVAPPTNPPLQRASRMQSDR